jgi:hypothetical protein
VGVSVWVCVCVCVHVCHCARICACPLVMLTVSGGHQWGHVPRARPAGKQLDEQLGLRPSHVMWWRRCAWSSHPLMFCPSGPAFVAVTSVGFTCTSPSLPSVALCVLFHALPLSLCLCPAPSHYPYACPSPSRPLALFLSLPLSLPPALSMPLSVSVSLVSRLSSLSLSLPPPPLSSLSLSLSGTLAARRRPAHGHVAGCRGALRDWRAPRHVRQPHVQKDAARAAAPRLQQR